MKAVETAHSKRIESVPFSRPLLEQYGRRRAITAALADLEAAQGDCLDREISAEDIAPALAYLSEQSDKAKIHCERFSTGLLEPDQSQRFEITSQALRLIRRQFGNGPKG